LLAMRWFYRLADEIIALTLPMKVELVNSLKLRSDKVRVIGNMLDLDRIERLSQDESNQERIRGLQPYWIAIGRLVPQNDFFTLLNAVARTEETVCPRLVVLGDGPLRRRLEEQSRRLGI